MLCEETIHVYSNNNRQLSISDGFTYSDPVMWDKTVNDFLGWVNLGGGACDEGARF